MAHTHPCREMADSGHAERLLAAFGDFKHCFTCRSTKDLEAHALHGKFPEHCSKWDIVPLCADCHRKLHSRFLGVPSMPQPKAVVHFAKCIIKVFDQKEGSVVERLRHWIPGQKAGWLFRSLKITKGRKSTSANSVLADIYATGRQPSRQRKAGIHPPRRAPSALDAMNVPKTSDGHSPR